MQEASLTPLNINKLFGWSLTVIDHGDNKEIIHSEYLLKNYLNISVELPKLRRET